MLQGKCAGSFQRDAPLEIKMCGMPFWLTYFWIAALPGQVISRQSPNVDYVSGATQSTNAFYYAVVDALSKAK